MHLLLKADQKSVIPYVKNINILVLSLTNMWISNLKMN